MKTSRPQTLIPCALLALILLLSAALLPAGGHAFAQSFSVHAEDDAVVWQAYPGATSYIVEVTHPSGTATDAEFPGSATFAPFAALFDVGGEYTVTVYAVVNGERVASASIPCAHRVTLPAPTGFSFDGDILTWQQTSGATSYSVAVNGIDFGAVSDPAFSLGTILALTGEYTVTVTALGDSTRTATPLLSSSSLRLLPCRPMTSSSPKRAGRSSQAGHRLREKLPNAMFISSYLAIKCWYPKKRRAISLSSPTP